MKDPSAMFLSHAWDIFMPLRLVPYRYDILIRMFPFLTYIEFLVCTSAHNSHVLSPFVFLFFFGSGITPHNLYSNS